MANKLCKPCNGERPELNHYWDSDTGKRIINQILPAELESECICSRHKKMSATWAKSHEDYAMLCDAIMNSKYRDL